MYKRLKKGADIMPIRIDDELPAKQNLEIENIFVMSKSRANMQDIRPLKIIILNLMPTKLETETQLLRLLSNSPLQLDIDFLQVKSHKAKNVYSTFHICWGAQAGLYYHYGIKKYPLKKKMFGVFPHKSLDITHPLMRGLDDVYYVPHSRHTETRLQDIALVKQLQVISYSEISGVHIISDMDCRQFFVTGHSEYDRDTLAKEYFRDKEKGLDIDVPYNYFPNDDDKSVPIMSWKSSANIIFSNWLNYFVYQKTPYDLAQL